MPRTGSIGGSQGTPTIRRSYTGVDKLIMAAMLDESANAAAMAASGYMPCGRGIGYFGPARDTFSHIPTPGNKSEWELYQLLERANLLNYFGTFLNFGGDDVQQLSDADEDEFLEIMGLVGMTQKPLHVRRLQKALIEWRQDHHMGHHNPDSATNFRRPQMLVGSQTPGGDRSHLLLAASALYESSAPTPISLASSSQSATTHTSNDSLSGSLFSSAPLPHEVLVGAPKRPRLMDDLLRKRDSNDWSPSKSVGHHANQANLSHLQPYHQEQQQQQPHHMLQHHQIQDQQLQSNPPQQPTTAPCEQTAPSSEARVRQQQDHDKEDEDRMIDILDESQSDAEQDEQGSARTLHSKFGRYQASLQSDNPEKPTQDS